MTTINRAIQHGAKANVNGSPAEDRADGPSAELILDGVIASYIHEISVRHRHPQTDGDRPATH